MYHEYFGLSQAPFKNTPDTRLFYTGGSRGEILDALVYAISSGEGIIKVVGEVGSGKTMLCRMLEVRLPDNVEIVYLANPSLSPENILHAIALEMNLPIAPDANRLQVMQALQQRLLEKHTANLQVVVFVEEAQSMPLETLEEIRLLSNLETQRDKLLQIVLFGQPELDRNLDAPHIRQLKERITHSFYLSPLKGHDIRDYVDYRLRAVGYRGPDVFSKSAYNTLARASEGLIRRINTLADKSLLAAFARDTHSVTPKCVRTAVDDSTFERRTPLGATQFALVAGVLLVAAVVAWAGFGPAELSWGEVSPPRARPEPGAASGRPGISSTLPGGEAVQAGRSGPHGSGTAAAAAAEPGMVSEATAPDKGLDEAADEAVRRGGERKDRPPATGIVKSKDGTDPVTVREAEAAEQTATASAGLPETEAGRSFGKEPASAGRPTQFAADPAFDSLIAERINATQGWLTQVDPRRYSIQLLMTEVNQRRFLENFLARWQRLGDLDALYVYKTDLRGKTWYGVLYSEYATLTEARKVLEGLPPEVKRHNPFIRNISDVAALG